MQPVIRNRVRFAAVLAALALASGGLGCAFGEIYWSDPLKREHSLSEIQKRYTKYVRFGAFARASEFVDPKLSHSFLANFPSRSQLIFTDSEAGRIDFGENGKRDGAVVRVVYSAYYSSAPVVFEVVEIQHWYREGIGNSWRVRPQFEGLKKLAAAN